MLNDFVAGAMRTKKIEILSNGQPWRPLIDVRDMSRAMVWGVSRRDAQDAQPFRVVNVGNNQWNFRIVELAEAAKSILKDVDVTVNSNAAPDKRSYRVNFDEFNRLAPADLRPKETIEGTIQKLADQLSNASAVTADFRKGPFMRLNVLRGLIEAGRIDNKLNFKVLS